MRQARAQRGGARRGRGGHTERTPAPALTLVNYPPLAATARADGGDATTTAGVSAGGDEAGVGAHAQARQAARTTAPWHRGVGRPLPRAAARCEGGMRVELRRATA
jgi:hypothetical protein